MILVKAPLRVSFFGGGTDLPVFCDHRVGKVLSTAIDKYMYIAVNTNQSGKIKLSYSEVEVVDNVMNLKNDIAKWAIELFGGRRAKNGLEIASFADIPTVGTGLGSSSTYAVALVEAMSVLNGFRFFPTTVANSACMIEIDYCKSPIGRQDQYASACGGMNILSFRGEGVAVQPLVLSTETERKLTDNLVMFYTGIQRSANDILKKQSEAPSIEMMQFMADQVDIAVKYLKDNDVDSFGDELDHAWYLKKQLAGGITTPLLDNIYEAGKFYGALGGKVLGAGGGGYFLFYVPNEDVKQKVIENMQLNGLQYVPFGISKTGVEVVYDSRNV